MKEEISAFLKKDSYNIIWNIRIDFPLAKHNQRQ